MTILRFPNNPYNQRMVSIVIPNSYRTQPALICKIEVLPFSVKNIRCKKTVAPHSPYMILHMSLCRPVHILGMGLPP